MRHLVLNEPFSLDPAGRRQRRATGRQRPGVLGETLLGGSAAAAGLNGETAGRPAEIRGPKENRNPKPESVAPFWGIAGMNMRRMEHRAPASLIGVAAIFNPTRVSGWPRKPNCAWRNISDFGLLSDFGSRGANCKTQYLTRHLVFSRTSCPQHLGGGEGFCNWLSDFGFSSAALPGSR